MNLSDARTRVADDGNTNVSASGVSARITREINRISKEIWESRAWSWRWRNYSIVTDIDVTAGTVTATNSSRTVTASGTPFLSSHLNWHIYFPNDVTLNWYKVRKFTSTSQIELNVPYQGSTGAGKSYVLRHLDYVLPTEPWDFGSFVATHSNRPLAVLDPSSMDNLTVAPLQNGYPMAISIYGSDSKPTTYTTGTVSGTLDTATLTGVGTAWLANVYPGDDVTIGSYTYKVYSVDSDTSISLYNNQQVTSTAATYIITRQFGRIARILWPSNLNFVIETRALRKYTPLVNNNDTNELLERMPEVVILKAAALELKQQNDRRSSLLVQEANMALTNAKAEDDVLTQTMNTVPIYTYRTSGRRERCV